jgi:thymidylate synthase
MVSGMMNQGWSNTYRDLIGMVLKFGAVRPSREGDTLDNGPTHISLNHPIEFQVLEGRGGSMSFAVTEQLCYLSGSDSTPLIAHAPSYERFRVNGTWPGAYGPRIARGIAKVVDILSKDPNSRQGVLDIHNINDTFRVGTGVYGVDVPCTLALVFYTVGNTLCLHATMRSSDLWFGIYYDIPAFCFIQQRVAEALGLYAGRFDLTTTSLHLYRKHEAKAKALVALEGGPIVLETANQLTNWEPDETGTPAYRIQSMQITASKILGLEADNGTK